MSHQILCCLFFSLLLEIWGKKRARLTSQMQLVDASLVLGQHVELLLRQGDDLLHLLEDGLGLFGGGVGTLDIDVWRVSQVCFPSLSGRRLLSCNGLFPPNGSEYVLVRLIIFSSNNNNNNDDDDDNTRKKDMK